VTAISQRLQGWWRRRRRKTDIEILWPICKERANDDMAKARMAFFWHIMHDSAWGDMSEAEKIKFVDNLR